MNLKIDSIPARELISRLRDDATPLGEMAAEVIERLILQVANVLMDKAIQAGEEAAKSGSIEATAIAVINVQVLATAFNPLIQQYGAPKLIDGARLAGELLDNQTFIGAFKRFDRKQGK